MVHHTTKVANYIYDSFSEFLGDYVKWKTTYFKIHILYVLHDFIKQHFEIKKSVEMENGQVTSKCQRQ